jgi:hypothetical protein
VIWELVLSYYWYNTPNSPEPWAVYQTVSPGEGATSCGREPDGTGNSCSIVLDNLCLTCACEVCCSATVMIIITEATTSEDITSNEEPTTLHLLVI